MVKNTNGLKMYIPDEGKISSDNYQPWEGSVEAVKVFIAEDQQILREAYQSYFLPRPEVEVVGTASDTNSSSLVNAIASASPRVLLLGVKVLQAATVELLKVIRSKSAGVGIVLLSAYFDAKGIKALREFSKGTSKGCAFLLKHTIDTPDQLTQVIQSVAEGRIIVDPSIMEGLISSADTKTSVLKDLSPREIEVLSWMAKGFRNGTIAEVLCLEPKTVERHINNIYSKLGDFPEAKHARVYAVMLYLRATGMLHIESMEE